MLKVMERPIVSRRKLTSRIILGNIYAYQMPCDGISLLGRPFELAVLTDVLKCHVQCFLLPWLWRLVAMLNEQSMEPHQVPPYMERPACS